MTAKFSGGCLCGAVRYEADVEPVVTAHCYCVDCRRSSGSSHCSHMAMPPDSVRITGEVTVYDRPADSGNIVGRAFCPACGAPVYSINSAMPGMVFLRASSLDDLKVFKPQMIVYASRAPSWGHLDSALPAFDTLPEGGPKKVIAERLGE